MPIEEGKPLTNMLSGIRNVLRLRAECSGLSFPNDSARIKELAIELDSLKAFDRPRELPECHGFYPGMEALGTVWTRGHVVREQGLAFLWAAADFIAASHVDADTYFPLNSCALAGRYGPDAAEMLCDALDEAAQSASRSWRRLELVEEDDDGRQIGEPRYAPVGSDRKGFEECGAVECDETDEHASPMTELELGERYDDLIELLTLKDRAANLARRKATGAPNV